MIERNSKLAEFCAETTFEKLNSKVVERTKLTILDSIGAILGGLVEPEVKEFLTIRSGRKTNRRCIKIMGLNKWAERSDAALIHGLAGTTLEMDEGNQFAKGHPSMHVLPALISATQSELLSCPVSGKDFITAFVIGYDVGARIGLSSQLRSQMHPHGTWGVVGASSAIGSLLKFDRDQHAQLINISSSLSTATSRKTMLEGGTVRNVYAGLSNQMGHLAIDLIQSGFCGEIDGLGSVFGKIVSENLDDGLLLEELGHRFEVMRNYFKLHACCRYNHAALDCLHTLTQRHQELFDIETISFINVESYSLAAELDSPTPKNMLAAKFSLPFALATTLVNKSSKVTSFSGNSLTKKATLDLAKKVTVNESPSMTAMLPEFRPAKVIIGLKNGKTLSESVKTNKGDWQNPYSSDDLQDKFYSLAKRIFNEHKAQTIFKQLSDLDQLKDMKDLFQFI